MGMAAIFISILSMIAVIYQSYLAREENELMRIQQSATVLPYLDYWYSNVGQEYEFVIENKGVGPALIKDVQFIAKDLESNDSLFFDDCHKLVEDVEQKSIFLDSISVIKSSFNSNMLLSPNEKKKFLAFSFDNHNQKRRFRDEFYKYYVGVKIIYEDVYGSAWLFNSEKGYPVKIIRD